MSDQQPLKKKRDRMMFDFAPGVRQRLTTEAQQLGESLTNTLRTTVSLGLELLEACRSLKIPLPRVGEVRQWLQERTRLGEEILAACRSLNIFPPEPGNVRQWLVNQTTISPELLEACRILNISPPNPGEVTRWLIELSRRNSRQEIAPYDSRGNAIGESQPFLKLLVEISERPTNAEIVQLAAQFGVETEDLLQLCNRLFPKSEKQENGCH